MAIDTYAFRDFCESWLRKSNGYKTGRLADPFDEFFTLFVVYNRIYVEIGKVLIRSHHRSVAQFLRQPRYARHVNNVHLPVRPLPDKTSAVRLASVYLRSNNIDAHIFAECEDDIAYLVSAIELGGFYFNYDYENEAPDLNRDTQLATRARGGQIEAVLELIYLARCNMFHGTKEFQDVQRQLLESMSNILRCISTQVLPRLVGG
ncbi:TPA: hypothetical protein NKV74_003512 [Vibrio parahaemolyticus]|nr:hypothetical protein [Vibrio parahaemolyticus]